MKGKCVSLLGNLGSYSKLPNLRNCQKAARERSSCLLALSVEVSYQDTWKKNAWIVIALFLQKLRMYILTDLACLRSFLARLLQETRLI